MPQRASQLKLGKRLNHTWLNKRNRCMYLTNKNQRKAHDMCCCCHLFYMKCLTYTKAHNATLQHDLQNKEGQALAAIKRNELSIPDKPTQQQV